jgi:hypothetical protein
MNNLKVSIFKNLYKSKDVPYIVTISKIIERIKEGSSKELILKIRNSKDKEEKDSYKRNLPSILFSGEFKERNGNGLKTHSGLMVVDFDKYPTPESMNIHLEELKKINHFVLLFISPSGNGIKGVLKVSNKLNKETHPKIFKAFQNKFKLDYFDIANSNIDRVCFESYDQNIYVNFEAKEFDSEIFDTGFTFSEKVPVLAINDESQIIEKIMAFNFQKDFQDGEKNNFILDLAGQFCEYGVSQGTAEGYIYNKFIAGNCKDEKGKLNAIKSAYKIRVFESKFFEDYSKITRIKLDLKKGKNKVIEKHKISEDVFEEIKEADEHDDFWIINVDKNGNQKISINSLKYKLFLERNGFKKYFPVDSQKSNFVFIESNKVIETSIEIIKDFVLNYLSERSEFEVWNYCSTYQNLFSDNYLLMLDTIELKMLNDQKHKSFIAFQNGILEVTKKEIKLIDYIDVDGYVWKNQIIKRNFKSIDDFDNEYRTFICNISNNEPLAIEVVIGYLISTYKNKMNNKAVILNDEVISDNPEGGTGKGLFVQGLKQIRNVSILDGKSFDDKKSFPYQTVSQETNILVFDDVKKNFDFESKFSLVTEGITLERKNKDAVKLKVEESPKMLLSTNYAIKGEGNSHDRRRHEIEIAQYYGKDLTPYDEFKRQLFDDWSEDEFLLFDNYMVNCLQSYLKIGLIKQENAKNIKLRKFIAESSMDFYEWISEEDNFSFNTRYNKIDKFTQFIHDFQDYKNNLRQKRFTIWVKKYANFLNLKYDEDTTNGNRWFEIINKNAKIEEDENIPF